MKNFDLTLSAREENPKVHKVSQEDFRKGLADFPRELAERMVELGYGRWIPYSSSGNVPVPQALTFPEQIFFVNLPTHAVKGAHVNSLVEGLGPVPGNLVFFCHNLKEDINFTHTEEDKKDVHISEEDELYDILEPSPEVPFEHDPKDLEEPVFSEDDDLAEILEAGDLFTPEANKPATPAKNRVEETKKAEKKASPDGDGKAEVVNGDSDSLAKAVQETADKETEKKAEKTKDDIQGDPPG